MLNEYSKESLTFVGISQFRRCQSALDQMEIFSVSGLKTGSNFYGRLALIALGFHLI